MSIALVMPFNHRILWLPLLLLQSFPASRSFPVSQLFASGDQSIGVSAWASVLPVNIYSELISFRIDWFDLLAVQMTQESSPTPNSKASILQHSVFFIVQLSHPYMTTGKTIALTWWTLVGKVMSLLFNIQSRLVIIFHPRSKHLLISWLQSPSAVILETPPNKVCHCFHCFHIYLPLSAMILGFLNVEFWPSFFILLFPFHQESSPTLSQLNRYIHNQFPFLIIPI